MKKKKANRIYAVAQEMGITFQEVIKYLSEIGIQKTSRRDVLSLDELEMLKSYYGVVLQQHNKASDSLNNDQSLTEINNTNITDNRLPSYHTDIDRKGDSCVTKSYQDLPNVDGINYESIEVEISDSINLSNLPFKVALYKKYLQDHNKDNREIGELSYKNYREYTDKLMTFSHDVTTNLDRIEDNVPKNKMYGNGFVIDIINNQVFKFVKDSIIASHMPYYVEYEKGGKKYYKCFENGFYGNNRMFSPFSAFGDKSLAEVVRLSIKDFFHEEKNTLPTKKTDSVPFDDRFICLMPDVMDDFDHSIRNGLIEYEGYRFLLIPRSIAACYAAIGKNKKLPQYIYCIDFDGFKASVVEIEVDYKNKYASGLPVFKRNALRRMDTITEETYSHFAWKYIGSCLDQLDETSGEQIILTKLLSQVIRNNKKYPVWADNNLSYLKYDEACYTKIIADIKRCKKKIDNRIHELNLGNNNFISIVISDLIKENTVEHIFNSVNLTSGCKIIRKRRKDFPNEPLWVEEIPDMRIETLEKGYYNQLKLVDKEQRNQKITTKSMNESITLTTGDTNLVLYAGSAKYYLPLLREERKNDKEVVLEPYKQACIYIEKPIEINLEVDLKLKYNYGAVNPFILEVKALNHKFSDLAIKVEWTEFEQLDNPVPDYKEEYKDITPNDIKVFDKDINDFINDIKNINVISKLKKINNNNDIIVTEQTIDVLRTFNKGANGRFYSVQRLFDAAQQANYEYILNIEPAVKEFDLLFRNHVLEYFAAFINQDLPVNCDDQVYGSYNFLTDQEKKVLAYNIASIVIWFGDFYNDSFAENYSKYPVKRIAKSFMRFFYAEDLPEYWIPLSRRIDIYEDSYDIFGKLYNSLCRIYLSNNKQFDLKQKSLLRSIGYVCWQRESWIFNLYNYEKGPELLYSITDVLIKEIKNEVDIEIPKAIDNYKVSKKTYNPRKIRDYLELLLCVCRVRALDHEFLDCNSESTKNIVIYLKKINNWIRDLKDSEIINPKKPFITRISKINPPPARYFGMHKLLFALIATLSGGKEKIELAGFTSNG